MRFLLDENLGRSLGEGLETLDHDVVSVSRLGLPPMSDVEVVEASATTGRALLTLDEGFANPLRFDPSSTGGIIVVSLPDERSPDVGAPTERVLQHADDARRAVADLWLEVERLDGEVEDAEHEVARLQAAADAALADGRGTGARELAAVLRRATIHREVVAAQRAGRRSQAARAASEADSLSLRFYDVVFEHAMERAHALTEDVPAASIDPQLVPEPDGPVRDRVAFAGAIVSPPVHDHDERYQNDARYRATYIEARLHAALSRVWGSLARELAIALTRLLTALETHDPAGHLWLVDVDGVREFRDSPLT